jgi:hypothetical protein
MSVLKSLHTDCPYQFTYAHAKPSVTALLVCLYEAGFSLMPQYRHSPATTKRAWTHTVYGDYMRNHTTYSVPSILQRTELGVGTIVSDSRLHADRTSFWSILISIPWRCRYRRQLQEDAG